MSRFHPGTRESGSSLRPVAAVRQVELHHDLPNPLCSLGSAETVRRALQVSNRDDVSSSVPTPSRVEVIEGRRIEIEWEDGSTTSMSAAALRALCACAGCLQNPPEERTARAHAAARIDSASFVGSYAMAFVFSPDNHTTGIFPFTGLHGYEPE